MSSASLSISPLRLRTRTIARYGLFGKDVFQALRMPLVIALIACVLLGVVRFSMQFTSGDHDAVLASLATIIGQAWLPVVALLTGAMSWTDERVDETEHLVGALPLGSRHLVLSKLGACLLALTAVWPISTAGLALVAGMDPVEGIGRVMHAYPSGGILFDPRGAAFAVALVTTGLAVGVRSRAEHLPTILLALVIVAAIEGTSLTVLYGRIAVMIGEEASGAPLLAVHLVWALCATALALGRRRAARSSENTRSISTRFLPQTIERIGTRSGMIAATIACAAIVGAASAARSAAFFDNVMRSRMEWAILVVPLIVSGLLGAASLLPQYRDPRPCMHDLLPVSALRTHARRLATVMGSAVVIALAALAGCSRQSGILARNSWSPGGWYIEGTVPHWAITAGAALVSSCIAAATLGYALRFLARSVVTAGLLGGVVALAWGGWGFAVTGSIWLRPVAELTSPRVLEALAWPTLIQPPMACVFALLVAESPLRYVSDSRRGPLSAVLVPVLLLWGMLIVTASPIDLFELTFR